MIKKNLSEIRQEKLDQVKLKNVLEEHIRCFQNGCLMCALKNVLKIL